MKLELRLAQVKKPLLTALCDEGSGYRAKALVRAINHARAFGQAHLLITVFRDPTVAEENLERALNEIKGLSIAPDEFEVKPMPISKDEYGKIDAFRIDICSKVDA